MAERKSEAGQASKECAEFAPLDGRGCDNSAMGKRGMRDMLKRAEMNAREILYAKRFVFLLRWRINLV